MEQKKRAAVWLIIGVALAVICLAGSRSFGDDAADPSGERYSGKPAADIGAWYDEMWAASKCALSQADGSYALNQPVPQTSLTSFQKNGDASMPQDMVVTEWEVTGHVHFQSSGS